MEKSILGIDVSKKELVVVLLTNNKKKESTFSNDQEGCKQLHKWIQKVETNKVLACAEATGQYSEKVAEYLYSKGYEVSIVNPFCIKSYSNSILARHKNDQVDAFVIAKYAQLHNVPLYKPKGPVIKELQYLYRCLQDLKNMRTQVGNHLESEVPRSVSNTWESVLKEIEERIISIEENIKQIIFESSELLEHYNNLQSIPGISKLTAVAILAEVPDVSSFRNARQLAAYAGLTPKHRLSGSSLKGKSRISKIGSGILRKALYFPAVAAKRHNPVIKLFCEKLDEKGKNIMAIICAAMRKLIHIIYGVLKSKKPFDKNLITT